MGVDILVLSEDRGQGFETIAAILGRLLKTHGPMGEPLVNVMPSEDRVVCEAAHANLWKSSSGYDYHKKVSLARTIATKLALGVVVVFHYDGDTPWANRTGAQTPAQFERRLRIPVRQHLSKHPDLVESRLARLIEATPCYSVEAWTYQSIDQAIEICRRQYSGRDVDKFEEWSLDRGALDEVVKPKEETCLSSKHNSELAEHVPCKEVLAVGKSFAELVRRLRLCPELAPLIRETLSA